MNAETAEDLVPIRLDLQFDGVSLRDTFCFNRNDILTTPEMVRSRLSFTFQVAQGLCEDLELPRRHFYSAITDTIKRQLDEDSRTQCLDLTDQRTVIELNITINNFTLEDKFEWDMSEPENSPELFASKLAADLALGGEFVAAIAHEIRCQLKWKAKCYARSTKPLPPLEHPFRDEKSAREWGPTLKKAKDEKTEKCLRNMERASRRLRRSAI